MYIDALSFHARQFRYVAKQFARVEDTFKVVKKQIWTWCLELC